MGGERGDLCVQKVLMFRLNEGNRFVICSRATDLRKGGALARRFASCHSIHLMEWNS